MLNSITQPETHIEQVRELMFGQQIREYNHRLEQLESTLAHLLEGSQRRLNEIQESFVGELNAAITAVDKKIRALDLKTEEERADMRQQVEQLAEKLGSRLNNLEEEFKTSQGDSRKQLETSHEGLTNALHLAVESVNEHIQTLATKTQDEMTNLQRQAKRTEEKLERRYRSLTEEIESSTIDMRQELTKIQKGTRDELQTLQTQLFSELDKHFRAIREAKVSRDDMSEILIEFGMRIKGMSFVDDLPQLPAAGGTSEHR